MRDEIRELLIKHKLINYVEGYGYYSKRPFHSNQIKRFLEELCKLVLEDSDDGDIPNKRSQK